MKKTELINVKPPCKYYGRCGGCQLQHLANESQNQVKQEIAEKYLGSFGKVEDILVMDHPY